MAWYNESWTYRVKIIIQSSQINSDLIDFPVYLRGSDFGASVYINAKSAAEDFRFTKADETTELPFEIVSYNSGTNEFEIHVKVDFISNSSDTIIYLYYGNAGASAYAVTDTYGRNAVWSDYVLVTHDGGATVDSTGTHTLTANGGLVSGGVSSPTGSGTNYSSVSKYVNIGANNLNINNDFTITTWLDIDTDKNQNVILASGNSIVSPPGYWMFINRTSVSNGLSMQLDNGPGGALFAPDGTNTVAASDGWKKVAIVRNGNDYELFIDGASVDSKTETISGLNAVDDILIGKLNYGTSVYLEGSLSELRLIQDTKSSDWITTEFNNQNSPSTFYSVGAEETNGGGPTFKPRVNWFM